MHHNAIRIERETYWQNDCKVFIFFLPLSFFSIATDIVEQRLQKAKQMGADVVVNGKTENLKDIGRQI